MKKQNWYVNQKKYHFIYKTTCNVNSKYYLGMHSTDNLDDGYIGSGTRLWHSIKKYGRENFSIEILEFLSDRELLKIRELELINAEKLVDPLCMNLRVGGEGGWINQKDLSESSQLKILIGRKKGGSIGGPKGRQSWYAKVASGEIKHQTAGKPLSEEHKRKISLATKGKAASLGMTGKQQSEETKQKIRDSLRKTRESKKHGE
jgi:group I intron endonuclease